MILPAEMEIDPQTTLLRQVVLASLMNQKSDSVRPQQLKSPAQLHICMALAFVWAVLHYRWAESPKVEFLYNSDASRLASWKISSARQLCTISVVLKLQFIKLISVII